MKSRKSEQITFGIIAIVVVIVLHNFIFSDANSENTPGVLKEYSHVKTSQDRHVPYTQTQSTPNSGIRLRSLSDISSQHRHSYASRGENVDFSLSGANTTHRGNITNASQNYIASNNVVGGSKSAPMENNSIGNFAMLEVEPFSEANQPNEPMSRGIGFPGVYNPEPGDTGVVPIGETWILLILIATYFGWKLYRLRSIKDQ